MKNAVYLVTEFQVKCWEFVSYLKNPVEFVDPCQVGGQAIPVVHTDYNYRLTVAVSWDLLIAHAAGGGGRVS